MNGTKISKATILKLIIKINIWMCIISAVSILGVPFIISKINMASYEGAICVLGTAFLMPILLFAITWVICIIYAFKKNIAKGVKNAYMLMPIYYIFITFPFLSLVLYIMNRCG